MWILCCELCNRGDFKFGSDSGPLVRWLAGLISGGVLMNDRRAFAASHS